MGAEAAVTQSIPQRITHSRRTDQFILAMRENCRNIDVMRLASELVVDAVIEPEGPYGRVDPHRSGGRRFFTAGMR